MIYEPREDSELMKKHIKDYARGKVLDMGTGSGIQAIEAAKYADFVTAVDVEGDVIDWCEKNILNEKIDFHQSDLFNNVEGRFDLIMFNPPYLPEDKGITDRALYGGKLGYEVIERFLKEAGDYLTSEGKILLIFSSFSHPDKIKQIMDNLHYKYHEVDKVHISYEDIYLYELSL